MAHVTESRKACAVNPLKMSQPLGATYAFMGLGSFMPLMHGSQGCTSFGLVLPVRHFKEAIPLQTTAMNETTTTMGDPDPDTLWRLDLFHNAAGLTIERATKCMVTPMMKMSHEGFGRAVLTTGRLIVVNRYLCDVHRFGFPRLGKLAEAARATQAKMDLHDLSEELPTNWERIPEVACSAYDAHVALMAARRRLAEVAP